MYYIEREVNAANSTSNEALVLAIIWIIINDYARWTISPLLISQYSADIISHWHHGDVIEEILKHYALIQNKIDGPMMKLLLEGDNLFDSFNETNHAYQLGENADEEPLFYKSYYKKENAIWFVDSLKSFGRLKKDLMNQKLYYHRNGFFTMVYTGKEAPFRSIQTIFHELFLIYVTNINILLPKDESIIVYTYYPFKADKCHSSEPEILLDMSNIDAIPERFKFFRNKINNMYGCEMLVTAWHQEPFIYLHYSEDTDKKLTMYGIEGSLLSVLAERINFTMKLNNPANGTRGDILQNNSATGTFKMLVNGETNFTVNSYMYEKRRADVVQAAYSYYSCTLAIAVPKGMQMSPFERLTKPFKYRIWICISSSILLAIIVICSLKLWYPSKVQAFFMGYRNRIPFTNVWLIFYGGPVYSNLPGRNFARFLLTSWMIYTFVLRSAYVSELFYMLQDGRARMTLNSISEVVSHNYTFVSSPLGLRILQENVNTDNVEAMKADFDETNKRLANLQKSSARFVFVIFREIIMSYNQHIAHDHTPISILPESLVTAPITLYMPKHTYLKHFVDELLLSITSSGIVNKFSKLYLKQSKFERDPEPLPLSMSLLWGCFSTYLILLSLCFIVFVIEVCSRKFLSISRILNFLNI